MGTSSWGSILRVSHLSHHTRTHHESSILPSRCRVNSGQSDLHNVPCDRPTAHVELTRVDSTCLARISSSRTIDRNTFHDIRTHHAIWSIPFVLRNMILHTALMTSSAERSRWHPVSATVMPLNQTSSMRNSILINKLTTSNVASLMIRSCPQILVPCYSLFLSEIDFPRPLYHVTG